MHQTLERTEHKSFDSPDEVREFPKGKAEILFIGGGEVGRYTVEPGWSWSEHLKPIAGTNSCEAPHFQYHVAGTLRIRMDDGAETFLDPYAAEDPAEFFAVASEEFVDRPGALRGAVQANRNDPDSIVAAAEELLRELMARNELQPERMARLALRGAGRYGCDAIESPRPVGSIYAFTGA